jgi:hypothetical protein
MADKEKSKTPGSSEALWNIASVVLFLGAVALFGSAVSRRH